MLFGKENMDFFNDKIKSMYLKYLEVHLFSLIYSVLDMAVVGKYQGLDGAAVLALVSPIWNVIYSLGLLMVLVDLFYFLLYVENKKATRLVQMNAFQPLLSVLRY